MRSGGRGIRPARDVDLPATVGAAIDAGDAGADAQIDAEVGEASPEGVDQEEGAPGEALDPWTRVVPEELRDAAAATAARGANRAVAGLGAAGAWLAGSGLAPVVADAVEEAERVRRAVLWGPDGR